MSSTICATGCGGSRARREELVDAADPAPVWDQFAAWVHQQVCVAASADTSCWSTERARELAEQVAQLFAEDGAMALPRAASTTPVAVRRA